MAVLEQQIQDKIDKLSEQSYEFYESGDKEKSYQLMEDAWNKYPEPKEKWNESFNTVRYALDDLLKDGEIEKAKIWYNRMTKIQKNLNLWVGIYEFYSGKYFYNKQEYSKAFNFFKKSVEIRKGLDYFIDQEPKYLKFFQNEILT